ncbi:MAG: sugar phosphate nucleotidyltransferase [Halobacteria archaeon]
MATRPPPPVGMVLCGGHGKRLMPLTQDIPKPLVELRPGYTILDRQLFDFSAANINRAILLTGHLGDKIEKRYGKEFKGVKIEYSVEEEPKGTLFAIRQGMEMAGPGTEVVVRNGDVVADVNLMKMMAHHHRHRGGLKATMFVTRMRSPYGIVELEGERIRSFREKPMLDQHINGGIYCLSPGIPMDGYDRGEIEKTVFPALAQSGELGHYREEGFWLAVDTVKELEEARKEYSNREDKPWGYEKVLVRTEKYMTKELFIREGYSTSVHYHKEKDETLYVQSGTLAVEFKDGVKKTFNRNDSFRITPGMHHRLIGLENVVLQEVSTPQLDDTVRVKDFYAAR